MPRKTEQPKTNPRYYTVGDLRKAIADVPDDTLIMSMPGGPFLKPGLVGGYAEVILVGSRKDQSIVFADDEHLGINSTWKGKKSAPKKVLILTD
jgi:hypothetical protein